MVNDTTILFNIQRALYAFWFVVSFFLHIWKGVPQCRFTILFLLYLWMIYSCLLTNRISGVMVSVLASNAVDRGFEPWSDKTKDYKIGMCCFSVKHTALRSKNKDWLARNQKNVSEWSEMSTRGLLSQWASTIKIQPNTV
jgi:hypothetical protein